MYLELIYIPEMIAAETDRGPINGGRVIRTPRDLSEAPKGSTTGMGPASLGPSKGSLNCSDSGMLS